ncbi:MAG: Cys-tRNA(Pro)/Cys-tRNA(Cys) deacylase [Actinomycetota bacterium]|jgi:Cys-tRNA(Pro)/Cys-tRNA(Cys) deacylase|nr:Cys-tRNA(Pro)/Cys-tRNA(Cys) deacylase [Actinomycetota bacterium]
MGARGTPATAMVAKAKVEHRIHEYHHDPAAASYGVEAAEQLGVDPAGVFKTLVAEVDGRLVVAVVPVAARLDLKALAAAAGSRRAVMAEPADAERATGYVVGGISPLGHRKRLPVFLDESMRDRPAVLVSAGRRGLELELAPADLARLAGATFATLISPV